MMLSLYTTITKITLYLCVCAGALYDINIAMTIAVWLCWYYTIGVILMPFMPESFKQYAGTSTTRFYIVFDLIASLMIGGIMYIAGNELTGATFIWQALGLAYISHVFYKQYHVKKIIDKQSIELINC